MPAAKVHWSVLIAWWIIITRIVSCTSGRLLVNSRTVQHMKTDMAKTHSDHVTKQLQQVNAVCTYIVYKTQH